jgi:hypothetical protein
MQNIERVPGWGVDADPKNNPVYPMRDVTADDQQGMSWQRPTLQTTDIEVLKSTERPSLSAVFGTAVPPAGLSGAIRRRAFQYSEGRWAHWLMLLMADRINVIEGVFQDLAHLHFPNVYREMGGPSEWKYNRSGFWRKTFYALIPMILIIAVVAWAVYD